MLGRLIDSLIEFVPQNTDLFSETLDVLEISVSDGTVAVKFSSKHGLKTGNTLQFSGFGIVNPVSSVSAFSAFSSDVVMVTENEHDLTQGYQSSVKIIDSKGALTGDPKLVSVSNRKTYGVLYDTAPDLSKIGDVSLIEYREVGPINGMKEISVIDEFTVSFPFDPYFAGFDIYKDSESSRVVKMARIAGGAEINRIIKGYERTDSKNYWLYAILDDVQIGKNREAPQDSQADQGRNSYWNLEFMREFTLFMFIPLESDTIGFTASDIADRTRSALYKSIGGLFLEPDTPGLYQYSGVVPLGDGPLMITNAYYVHAYKWQLTSQVSRDAINPGMPSRAFRDIHLATVNDFETTLTNDTIDLDQIPLEGAINDHS